MPDDQGSTTTNILNARSRRQGRAVPAQAAGRGGSYEEHLTGFADDFDTGTPEPSPDDVLARLETTRTALPEPVSQAPPMGALGERVDDRRKPDEILNALSAPRPPDAGARSGAPRGSAELPAGTRPPRTVRRPRMRRDRRHGRRALAVITLAVAALAALLVSFNNENRPRDASQLLPTAAHATAARTAAAVPVRPSTNVVKATVDRVAARSFPAQKHPHRLRPPRRRSHPASRPTAATAAARSVPSYSPPQRATQSFSAGGGSSYGSSSGGSGTNPRPESTSSADTSSSSAAAAPASPTPASAPAGPAGYAGGVVGTNCDPQCR